MKLAVNKMGLGHSYNQLDTMAYSDHPHEVDDETIVYAHMACSTHGHPVVLSPCHPHVVENTIDPGPDGANVSIGPSPVGGEWTLTKNVGSPGEEVRNIALKACNMMQQLSEL